MDTMNLKQVEVVIIILTINQKENTLKCLESLSHIDFHSWEVILVENGSSDGTAEEVSETFPEVSIIKNGYNSGVSEGRNIGIKYADEHFTYDFLLFLDNDTIVEKTFLSELVKSIKSDQEIGATFPKVYALDTPGQFQAAGNCKINFYTGKYTCKAAGKTDKGQYNNFIYSEIASSTACLVKREVISKIGGFDEIYDPFGFEDLDFFCRAVRKGFKILFVPTALVHHKISRTPSNGKYDEVFTRLKGRNMRIFMNRHATLFQKACFYCISPILAACTFVRELRKNNAKAALMLFKSFFFFDKKIKRSKSL